MVEKYSVIYPSGEIRLEEINRELMLDRMHEIIGCDCLEQVHTIVPGMVLIVDESGKIKDPPQQHNELASLLYMGYLKGPDDICGPAILASLQPTGPLEEMDWFPITQFHACVLHMMGFELPEVANET